MGEFLADKGYFFICVLISRTIKYGDNFLSDGHIIDPPCRVEKQVSIFFGYRTVFERNKYKFFLFKETGFYSSFYGYPAFEAECSLLVFMDTNIFEFSGFIIFECF
ncbi:hypothetical protein D9M68_611770 [compost metagenome]